MAGLLPFPPAQSRRSLPSPGLSQAWVKLFPSGGFLGSDGLTRVTSLEEDGHMGSGGSQCALLGSQTPPTSPLRALGSQVSDWL